MKLNDKHLAAFAAGTAPTDKEGYLMKKGEVNKAYQKRWFVLKGNLLFYFEKKGDKDPIGVVILEGCTVELSENCDAYTFELVFQGSSSRTYVLVAESQEEMEDWMKAIACGGYDYMKLMVAELQRQMDDLGVEQPKTTHAPAPVPPPRAKKPTPTPAPAETQLAVLVDLSVPDASQRHAARVNPFNSGKAPQRQMDMFGATPFKADYFGSEMQAQPRDFARMHRDYGIYIKQKTSEYKTDSKSIPLVTFD